MSLAAQDDRPTGQAGPSPGTLHSILDLIEQHAAKAPDDLALMDRNRQVTYGQLSRCANQIARRLLRIGVGPDRAVGILARPCWQTLVGILAILKSGGAYVPIDPKQPWQRTAAILGECDVKALLGIDLQGAIEGDLWCDVFSLDHVDPQRADRSPPPVNVQGEQLAYILYTSGSTGRPNGVLVTHDNLMHSTLARLSFYEQSVDRFLLLSPLTFDSSVAGIFWTLCSGGTLVLPDAKTTSHLATLADTIHRRRISHLLCVPSLWKALLGSDCRNKSWSDLRVVITAGEACSGGLVERHFARLPHVGLYNEYGPTEATVWSTVHRAAPTETDSVPIGKPIARTKVYIVDSKLRQVTPGQRGELCIAGSGVARGYLKREELTSRAFLPNPFDDGDHSRLYRTGDLVQQRPDGKLLFCGRIDDQLNVRGRRIEPVEIEAVLEQHRGVAQAAVFEHQGAIHARITLEADGSIGANELKSWCAEDLPHYMVPGDFHSVEAFPRTAHGKIDRRRVPTIDSRPLETDERGTIGISQPGCSFELELRHLWVELLQQPDVTPESNFFRMGADSLAVMELIAGIKRRYGRDLSLQDLTANPTIASLARLLRCAGRPSLWSPMVSLQPRGNKTPLFLVHPGGGNALCYLELARHLGDDQPLFGLQAPGVDGIRPPIHCIHKMADEYLEAIRNVQPSGPYQLGGWSFGGLVAYEIACRIIDNGDHVRTLALADSGIVYAIRLTQALFPAGDLSLRQLLTAPNDELLPHFRQMAGPSHVIPPGATDDQAAHVLTVFRANVLATLDYRPSCYHGKLLLIRGRDAVEDRRMNPRLEWDALCDDVVEERTSGEHLSLFRPPHVAELAAILQRHLQSS